MSSGQSRVKSRWNQLWDDLVLHVLVLVTICHAFFSLFSQPATIAMSHKPGGQDHSSSPRSVAWSDLSSSPGLPRRFLELHVGSPPDSHSSVSLIEASPVLSTTNINDLPIELIGEIIVKHSELEWYAPAVDIRVCKHWRSAVLSTARAWARIRFEGREVPPSQSALERWVERAASAPLDVRILGVRGVSLDETVLAYAVPIFLTKADTIVSFEVSSVQRAFFLTRFPRLRHLRVDAWSLQAPGYPDGGQFHVEPMPALRSLALGDISCEPFATNAITPLAELALSHNIGAWYSLVYHSHESLTSLSLFDCGPWAGDGRRIAFPNLAFLSLFDTPSFKPYIDSPRLQRLHEACDGLPDPFPHPLPSLTEYGVLARPLSHDSPRLHPERLHTEFPNLVRLSLRAPAVDTVEFFRELANFPACLPNLGCIEAENEAESHSEVGHPFGHQDIMAMEYHLSRRNQAAPSVPLRAWFWEPGKPRKIPLLFADVCDYQLYSLE